MVKKLYLIRHASAENSSNSSMVKDIERELISKGFIESARLGNHLAKNNVVFENLYCSPANRTVATAQILSEQLKIEEHNIIVDENLYGGGPRGYLALLNSIPENQKSVAIVGHNPDISFFCEYLTRDDIGGNLHKCTLIEMQFEDLKWAEISQKAGKFINRVDVTDLQDS